jgi:hypothetical protein
LIIISQDVKVLKKLSALSDNNLDYSFEEGNKKTLHQRSYATRRCYDLIPGHREDDC